jgi:hypothetical protein
MNTEAARNPRFPLARYPLIVLAIGVVAVGFLTSCSSASTGSPTAEDSALETSVNARLDSEFPCGVYATSDGKVIVTMSVAKSALGSSDAKAKAAAKDLVSRVFTDVPEVKSVQVLDRNKTEIGTFLPNQ